ncbi:MAG: 50S ribosomal protein L34e [Candidatus Aenigmatarchaeota archaeon]
MRSRVAWKRTRIVTPGGRNVFHFKKSRPAFHVCGQCGAKLNRPRLLRTEIRKIRKTERRPERRFPELCPACSRLALKARVK